MGTTQVMTEEELKKALEQSKVAPAVAPVSDALKFDVDKLIKEGRVEEEVDVAGMKIKMHTLTIGDYDAIASQSDKGIFAEDGSIKSDFGTISLILTRAITEIDKKRFESVDEKKVLKGILDNCQPLVINKMLAGWIKMQEKQSTILGDDNVKKNS